MANQSDQKNFLQNVRMLSGDVEHIIKWYAALSPIKLFCYYEVIGTFVSIINGRFNHEKQIILRGSSGPVLKVFFYGQDMVELPKTGDIIRSVGRMIDQNQMQAVKIRRALEDEKANLARIAYVCDQQVLRLMDDRKE